MLWDYAEKLDMCRDDIVPRSDVKNWCNKEDMGPKLKRSTGSGVLRGRGGLGHRLNLLIFWYVSVSPLYGSRVN